VDFRVFGKEGSPVATIRIPKRAAPMPDQRPDVVQSQVTQVELVTIAIPEACRIAGISRSQLYRWLAAGTIQAMKSGRRTLIVVDSLRRHIASLPPAKFGDAAGKG
jgi:excisionase family DNA binding protein